MNDETWELLGPTNFMLQLLLRPLRRVQLIATLAAVLSMPAASLTAATLVGNISNVATGNLLEGARVAVPALGLSALSDYTGQYTLGPLPPGTHEVLVSYTGLDTVRAQVVITDATITTRHFDLTADIYKLDAFKVVGEREGGAAAITTQRNADNVKNVVATTIWNSCSAQ